MNMYRLCFVNILKRNALNKITLQFNHITYSNYNKIQQITPQHHNNIVTRCITSKSQHINDETSYKCLTEQEFVVRVQNDPDIFGSSAKEDQPLDEDDVREEQFLENPPSAQQKLRTKQYADIIKEFIRKRKIKEAIDVLEVRMIKEDRVKPESYIFNLILGACGRVGYTKKAFSLYNKMKQRDLKISGGTYTALFNACANSPWPEDGLTRANHLREIMIEKRYEPNETNYNAMIKAYGRCGDLTTAFSLVDEMSQKRFDIKDDTLNFLLQACVTDKEAGFRHSLLVWRKFINKNIAPSIYSYNLLLKCVRECGLGDMKVTEDVLYRILQGNQLDNKRLIENSKESDNCLESATSECLHHPQSATNETEFGDVAKTEDNKLEQETKNSEGILQQNDKIINKDNVPTIFNSVSDIQDTVKVNNKAFPTSETLFEENRPNLLARKPHLGNMLSLSEVTKAEDRLVLIGSLSGFLQDMLENHCSPDIKTFTQLLECIPSTFPAEKELMASMKKCSVKPDVDFYNMLIKKRSMRFDYDSSQEVLNMMKKSKLRPDLVTYGVLALGCKTKEQAQILLEEMNQANYRLNAEILGAMLRQACHHCNFPYVLEIMEICVREQIRPNKKFMDHLEEFKKKCRNVTSDSENKLSTSKSFLKGFQIFKLRYKTWKNEADPINEDEIHPWQQFRQESATNVRHYKDKDEKSRFKARHTSLYRQKQGGNIVKNHKKLVNNDKIINKYGNSQSPRNQMHKITDAT